MLSAFVAELDRKRLRYCLLSGYREEPGVEPTDIDFMVLPEDARRTGPLLMDVARHSKARLVQAIQHETGAWYFALARQAGSEVAYLHPDCTTDYRRAGRLWMKADEVLARRRKLGAIFVPSAADEFLYYLIKKVLKQCIDPPHVQRLRLLYAAAPEECCEALQRHWSRLTAAAITSALLRGDTDWVRRQIRLLLDEMQASQLAEGLVRRNLQQARECRRWISRAANPTGASIVVYGGDENRRNEVAALLTETLRPAFRHAYAVDRTQSTIGPKEWLARVHSTLLVYEASSARGSNLLAGKPDITIDADELDLDSATQTALVWLEHRTLQRIGRG
jgi:hypothetical protein